MIEKPELVKVFPNEGVTIIIPPQLSFVLVRQKGFISPVTLKRIPLPEGFNLIRPVINIDLFNPHDHGRLQKTFEPPVEIHVRFTRADLAAAEAYKKTLQLAYLFQDKDRKWHWALFTKENSGFELKCDPNPETGGEGVVKISHWGDPMLVWGG
jgi:hypothetical protein